MAAFTQSLQKSGTRRIDEDLRRVQNDFRKGKLTPSEFRNALTNIRTSQQQLEQSFAGR
jgi:hypothetical protein